MEKKTLLEQVTTVIERWTPNIKALKPEAMDTFKRKVIQYTDISSKMLFDVSAIMFDFDLDIKIKGPDEEYSDIASSIQKYADEDENLKEAMADAFTSTISEALEHTVLHALLNDDKVFFKMLPGIILSDIVTNEEKDAEAVAEEIIRVCWSKSIAG